VYLRGKKEGKKGKGEGMGEITRRLSIIEKTGGAGDLVRG